MKATVHKEDVIYQKKDIYLKKNLTNMAYVQR